MRNSLRKFALVFVTSSVAAAQNAAPVPAIALLDSADAAQWQAWTKDAGWKVLAPAGLAPDAAVDARVQAIAAAVQEAVKAGTVDPARVYVAGRGDAAPAVFYTISRQPDLWAAGLALGGSPMAAINSDRVFAANFTNAPVLWVTTGANDQALAEKLKAAGVNMEWRSATGLSNGAVFQWLAAHKRDEFPASIDCETNSPTFGRCYWVQMTKFDPNERNDVLPSTRISGGTGAALDLGGFGFKPDDPGPGVLVAMLPPKYNGPLKMGDRLIELDGKPLENARQYVALMAKANSEKRVTVLVQRGKDRVRVETRIVLPVRDPVITARVQAKWDPETKGIDIVSRTVTEMKVTIPAQWVPANLYWNGLSLENITKPGCLLLNMEKEIMHAAVCP